MHTSCLGVAQSMLGAVLSELVDEDHFAGPIPFRLAQIFGLIKRYYGAMNTPARLANLKKSILGSRRHWSALSAKAAETQHLLFVMQFVLRDLNDGSAHHEHRLRAVCCLIRIYTAFKDGGLVLDPGVADSALEEMNLLYAHWHWLLCRAMGRGDLNWPVLQQMHTLYHIVHQSKYLNPRYTWCYQYEDYMRTVVMAAKTSMAGSPMHIIGSKVIEHALLVLTMGIAP